MTESNVCVNSEMAGITALVQPIRVIEESTRGKLPTPVQV